MLEEEFVFTVGAAVFYFVVIFNSGHLYIGPSAGVSAQIEVSLQAVCRIADSYARLYRLTLGLLPLLVAKHLWALYIQSR